MNTPGVTPSTRHRSLTVEVQEGEDTAVVGKLPERSTTPSNSQSYTCVFGFTQALDQIESNNIEYADSTQLFYQGEKGAEDTAFGWRGFVTEGTNDPGKGSVFIEHSRFRPAVDMQDWLKDNQSSAYNAQLWPNFPRSVETPQDNRNPWLACVQSETNPCGVSGE